MPMIRRGYKGPAVCACGDHAFAPATRHGIVLVDATDVNVLSGPWAMNQKGYAERTRQGKLHRFLLAAPKGALVDHKNGDRLDNRRRNLRLCGNAESLRNRGKLRPGGKSASPFKGVSFFRAEQRWAARISVDGKRIFLGYFENDADAARAYDAAAIKHHGTFARLNFERAA